MEGLEIRVALPDEATLVLGSAGMRSDRKPKG